MEQEEEKRTEEYYIDTGPGSDYTTFSKTWERRTIVQLDWGAEGIPINCSL